MYLGTKKNPADVMKFPFSFSLHYCVPFQINVVHINATAKNAADDKIRQSLRRFSDSHPPGTKVILISSKTRGWKILILCLT